MKKGDVVICIPGFNNSGHGVPNYGGAGYIEGDVFTIAEISESDGIVWPKNRCGVFIFAVKLQDRKSRIDKLKLE